MTGSTATIFKKVGEMEKNLQEIKVDLSLAFPKQRNTMAIYNDSEILGEVKKTRKKLWNEKY